MKTKNVIFLGPFHNIVTDGAIHFADPDARHSILQFYRALPQANPPPYCPAALTPFSKELNWPKAA